MSAVVGQGLAGSAWFARDHPGVALGAQLVGDRRGQVAGHCRGRAHAGRVRAIETLWLDGL